MRLYSKTGNDVDVTVTVYPCTDSGELNDTRKDVHSLPVLETENHLEKPEAGKSAFISRVIPFFAFHKQR